MKKCLHKFIAKNVDFFDSGKCFCGICDEAITQIPENSIVFCQYSSDYDEYYDENYILPITILKEMSNLYKTDIDFNPEEKFIELIDKIDRYSLKNTINKLRGQLKLTPKKFKFEYTEDVIEILDRLAIAVSDEEIDYNDILDKIKTLADKKIKEKGKSPKSLKQF